MGAAREKGAKATTWYVRKEWGVVGMRQGEDVDIQENRIYGAIHKSEQRRGRGIWEGMDEDAMPSNTTNSER